MQSPGVTALRRLSSSLSRTSTSSKEEEQLPKRRLAEILLQPDFVWFLANAMQEQVLRFQTGSQSKLKAADDWKNLRTGIICHLWMPLSNPAFSSDLNSRAINGGYSLLEDVAESLDLLLNELYIGSFKSRFGFLANETDEPWTLEVLEKIYRDPGSKFDIGKAFVELYSNRTAKSLKLAARSLNKLQKLLKEWAKGRDSQDPEDLEDNSNPRRAQHPIPTFDWKIFQGTHSVQLLTNLLHDTLHQHWPCPHNHHDHRGTLGECLHVKFQLDPRWNARGIADGLYLVFSGNQVLQECKVTVSEIHGTTSDTYENEICLVLHKETQCYCISLVLNKFKKLRWLHKQLLPMKMLEYGFKEMSLREVLRTVRMSPEAKRVVGLSLARTVLHLLGGRWAQSFLIIDNISVYYGEQNGQPCFHLDQMYLSTTFKSDNNQHYKIEDPVVHPVFSILCLGVILAQIELGHSLEEVEKECSLRPQPHDLSKIGRVLLNACRDVLLFPPTPIEFCLNPASFKCYEDIESTEIITSREFVETYYRNIIRPLEGDLIKAKGWTWKQVNWEDPYFLNKNGIVSRVPASGPIQTQSVTAIPVSGSKTRMPTITLNPLENENAQQQFVSWSGQPPGAVFDYKTSCPASSGAAAWADKWFQELQNIHKNIYSVLKDPVTESDKSKFVKVAVLDTGMDLNHDEFKPFLKCGQVVAYRDFIKGSDSIIDLDGHGTHVSHLLLKTAKHAMLYHGRVFESSEADEKTAGLVAKAIRHAVDKWDVDIISMSFAFEEVDDGIQAAIAYATDGGKDSKKRTLLFAAASNNRANRRNPVGYPAREDSVICVNSTTGQAKQSAFSPDGRPLDHNFAIIGEALEAAWPPSLNEGRPTKRSSGTSCATPIMAGIAAIILHISRMKEFGRFRKANQLTHSRGMKEVLYKCMTDMKVGDNYNYIKPGNLFDSKLTDIRVKIDDALDKL